MLWMAQQERGFTSARWLTYKQASEKGGQVRKGEKGTGIIFYKTLERTAAGRCRHRRGGEGSYSDVARVHRVQPRSDRRD